MIIKRGVGVQLVVFFIITVLGIGYAAIHYVGVGASLRNYTVSVDLPRTGGLFSNAEVTYRGVTVGRVSDIHLSGSGVVAELRIHNGTHIPKPLRAVVADRSAVGEQYIDLEPSRGVSVCHDARTNCLHAGDVIPASATTLPVPTADLLQNADAAVKQLNPADLKTVLSELNTALSGEGPDLQKIVDASTSAISTASATYPQFNTILHNSQQILTTQAGDAGAFLSLAHNLAGLTGELKSDDGAIRADLSATPPALTQADSLFHTLLPQVPTLLANGNVIGETTSAHIPGIRTMLITYPLAVAGTFTGVDPNGAARFGLVVNLNSPPVCEQGYGGTTPRWPQDTTAVPANLKAGCTEGPGSGIDIRGAQNAPPAIPPAALPPGALTGAGTPPPLPAGLGSSPGSGGKGSAALGDPGHGAAGIAGAWVAGYDPVTRAVLGPDGKTYQLAQIGGQAPMSGAAGWQWLLLGGLL